jgi:exosortase
MQRDSQPTEAVMCDSAGEQPLIFVADPAATPASLWLRWTVILLPLAWLWFRMIESVRLEWSSNPQYSYGWIVPVLCAGLLVRRCAAPRNSPRRETFVRWPAVLCFLTLSLSYLPTHLIEAAIPEWRPIQWSLGLIATGITLSAIYLSVGPGWFQQFAFPITFFLVAVPWPTFIETPVIQALTRANAAVVIEVMGWFGVPAMQHGNLIEIGTGTVGIDEACSGIRSFQSSIMISLFLGEFYRLRRPRRFLLLLLGFVLAFVFNVCRTSLLTWVAAKKGVDAIAQYHDPAGLTILIACTGAMWGLAFLLKKKAERNSQNDETVPAGISALPLSTLKFRLSAFLIAWLIFVEAGVRVWYRSKEENFTPSPNWSLVFPRNNPTFNVLPIAEKTRNLLRFDQGEQGEWREANGTQWQAFFFNWFPGRVAGYLAKRHTPEICMSAAGWQLREGPDLMLTKIRNIELPIRHYVFENPGQSVQVFQCRWEDGMRNDAYVQHETTRFNLLRGIWAGRGRRGQKVFELIISGCADSDQAKTALILQLEKLIQVEKKTASL